MTAVVRGHSWPIAEPQRFLRGPVAFVLNGDYLTVGYAGETFSTKASKDLSYIHRLPRNAAAQFHALDLLSGGGRDGRAGSVAELAGLNVTRAIKDALGMISEQHQVTVPSLAEIFRSAR